LSYLIKELLTNNDVNIKVLHYTNEHVIDLDLSLFTASELAKFKSYGSDKRKLEFYYSRVLWLTFKQNQIIKYKPTGKPILEKGFLSMSHSHNYVVICFSETMNLGIDVEMISEKINKVKSKFLHPKDKYVSLKDLTQLWTIKEAFFKLFDGEGVFLMDDVYTECLSENSTSELMLANLSLKGEFYSFFMEDNFIVTYIIPNNS
jgi:4'-phosphopantetheinyl transferase